MSFGQMVVLYICALLIFFAIDLIWIGVVAKKFYRAQLGFIMSPRVKWAPAIIFYSLYIVGVLYFAIVPALDGGSFGQAALNAAFLGLLCYTTYDLSNQATLKDWPIYVTVVDIIWGTTVTTAVAVLTFLIGQAIV